MDAGITRADKPIHMVFQKASAWLFMPQPKGLFVTLSSPRKASQSQTFPIYQEMKQPGSG